MSTCRPFPAQYPGQCTCGSRFNRGDKIYYDASIKRATLCPACRPPVAVMGTVHHQKNGINVRFDRHPATGVIVLAVFSDPTIYNSAEVYDFKGGGWHVRGAGRQMVHSRFLVHSQIERIRLECEEVNPEF